MTWRGSTTSLDRVFACLVYAFPMVQALLFYSGPFFRQLPFTQIIFAPLIPFVVVYQFIQTIVPFGLGGLIIFVALLFLVVRNDRVRHFIRFNTMQAILIGIVLTIFSLIWAFFATALGLQNPAGVALMLRDTVFNVLFLGAMVSSVYCIVQSIRGKYAEIPTLSDAVYMQVR
ncbi:MAG: Tic20 family protein [Elainellaceae cyanobacterium]